LEPSFWAPIDDLGRGLDFEGWLGAVDGASIEVFVPCKCEGRVTPSAGALGSS
jgi:hypothetical protein